MNKNVISLNETTGVVNNVDVKVISANILIKDMNNILKKINQKMLRKELIN